MSTVAVESEEEFTREVELSDRPVLVDFWAEWCGPCKQLAPRLEELDEEYPDLKIVKVDVEENQSLAQSFGVTSIPALFFFQDGERVHNLTGAHPTTVLRETVEEAFGLTSPASRAS